MEFEYTLSKQVCALLCQATASVLCWTGASFCPEFKISKEKTKAREYLHLPVVTSRSCILVLPTRPEIQTPTQGNCSWGSPLGAADTRAHHICCLPDPAESRLTQALPWLTCILSITDSSAKQCLRHWLWCLGLCRHTETQTCCDVLALQFTTGSNSLASAEEMGKTRSSKH